MLAELAITDFAIIDEARIEFEPGFNVLTGETGAGKSILIEALGLALGGRSSEEMIRVGAEQAMVEARFDISKAGAGLKATLAGQGLDNADELIIRRIVSKTGKNKVFVNGFMVTVAQLKSIGESVVDTHGQHESQALFNPRSHLPFLDRFLKLEDEREKYRGKYDKYVDAKLRLRKLRENQKEIEQRIDLLRYQVNEISEANLIPGEEEELFREKNRLTHTEKLIGLAGAILDELEDGETAAAIAIRKAKQAFDQMAELDNSLKNAAETMATAMFSLDEAASEIRRYAEGLERDPDRLEKVDDRLDLIRGLRKKYGDSVEEIIAFRERVEEELKSIEFDMEHIDRLVEEVTKLGQAAAAAAATLDNKRTRGAAEFAKSVEKQLRDLAMKAQIKPVFDYEEEPESPFVKDGKGRKMYPDGAGRMEILISSNPGEPARPLAKIASGGEISRLMLALKTVVSETQFTPVMIFDEIDTGIGGAVGARLGEKLRSLAKNSQVFCVTHLAQIAAQANAHYQVIKSVKKGRANVTITKLDRKGRIEELARMIGSEETSEAALAWAEESLSAFGE